MHRTVLKEALHAPQFCRLRSAFPCQRHLALIFTDEGTYNQSPLLTSQKALVS